MGLGILLTRKISLFNYIICDYISMLERKKREKERTKRDRKRGGGEREGGKETVNGETQNC